MGQLREVLFKEGTLTISNLTVDEGMEIVRRAESGSDLVLDTPEAPAKRPARPVAAPEPQAQAEAAPPPPAPRRGPPPPRVDESAIASAAAASKPKEPAVKPAKASAKAKAEAPPAEEEETSGEYERNDHGVLMPKGHMKKVEAEHGKVNAPPLDEPLEFYEEDEAAVAASLKPKTNGAAKTNGVNGHAKHVPVAEAESVTSRHEDTSEFDADEIPAPIASARKLGDLLKALLDMGITDPDDLKKECARLKPSVQLLQRITNLDARIDRTLEVMETGEDLV